MYKPDMTFYKKTDKLWTVGDFGLGVYHVFRPIINNKVDDNLENYGLGPLASLNVRSFLKL